MFCKIRKKVTYKKEAFTLIEVVAALAIISIFAAVLIPKVSKYVKEAKKTRALEDVKQVVLAVEDYNISSGNEIDEKNRFSVIKSKIGSDVVDVKSIKTISDDMTYGTMEEIIDGKKNFTLKDGKIQVTG